MTDWTNFNLNVFLPGEPLTSAKALAWYENPIAMAEGAAGAPRIDPIAAMEHQGEVGAVGTYAWLRRNTGGLVTQGDTVAGSQLRYAGFSSNATVDGNPFPTLETGSNFTQSNTAPAGTWRSMGQPGGFGEQTAIGLWLRIS